MADREGWAIGGDMSDEELEAAIDVVGRDRVFKRARDAG
jgi:hypothetical protein